MLFVSFLRHSPSLFPEGNLVSGMGHRYSYTIPLGPVSYYLVFKRMYAEKSVGGQRQNGRNIKNILRIYLVLCPFRVPGKIKIKIKSTPGCQFPLPTTYEDTCSDSPRSKAIQPAAWIAEAFLPRAGRRLPPPPTLTATYTQTLRCDSSPGKGEDTIPASSFQPASLAPVRKPDATNFCFVLFWFWFWFFFHSESDYNERKHHATEPKTTMGPPWTEQLQQH